MRHEPEAEHRKLVKRSPPNCANESRMFSVSPPARPLTGRLQICSIVTAHCRAWRCQSAAVAHALFESVSRVVTSLALEDPLG